MKPTKLTDQEIENLISETSISDQFPWCLNNDIEIDQFYKIVLFEVSRKTKMNFLADFDHYGSGYSSYIPTFFYEEDFRIKQLYPSYNQNFLGLEIYFCRLASYFIMIESEYRWQEKLNQNKSFDGFPNQNNINVIHDSKIQQKAQHIETLLSDYGLLKLDQVWLETPLSKHFKISTNLTNRAFSYFDAFFHWED